MNNSPAGLLALVQTSEKYEYQRTSFYDSPSLKTSVNELDAQKSDKFRTSLFSKFTDASLKGHIWENILEEHFDHVASYGDPDNEIYLLISDFVGYEEVFMVFDRLDEKSVFRFKDGSQIVPLLSECYDFEFYLTDHQLQYLLCLNDHDYLIAVGTAADWLKNLLDENRELKRPIHEIVSVR